jgi:hypothetical protein
LKARFFFSPQISVNLASFSGAMVFVRVEHQQTSNDDNCPCNAEQFRNWTLRCINAGFSTAEIFNQFAGSRGYDYRGHPPSTIEKWLKEAEHEDSVGCPHEFKPFLQIIWSEFLRVNEKIRKERMCSGEVITTCQLSFLNNQFSMDLVLSLIKTSYKLYLVDNVYGYKRLVFLDALQFSNK